MTGDSPAYQLVGIGSRAFWKLVRGVERQWSTVASMEDESGGVHMDQRIVEKIVLSEISKIFNN